MINSAYLSGFAGHKKAFVFGVGGGMDIATATLVANTLRRRASIKDIHIGGVLNPGCVHFYDRIAERPLNKIPFSTVNNPRLKRRLDRRSEGFLNEKKFIDPFLPQLLKAQRNKFNGYWNISFRFGMPRLIEKFKTFINVQGFDLVVGVDIGGDMLARGEQDINIQTPIMDFSSLSLLSGIPGSILFVTGLGVDCELTPDGISEIETELLRANIVLGRFKYQEGDGEIGKARVLLDEVRKTTSKKWNTMGYFLETIEAQAQGRTTSVKKIDVSTSTYGSIVTEMDLMPRYFGDCWILDPIRLAAIRQGVAFSYENTLEQYIRIKKICRRWKAENDGYFIWSGDKWTSLEQKGICLQLLCLSERFDEAYKKRFAQEAKEYLEENKSDAVLMFTGDIKYFQASDGYQIIDLPGGFSLVAAKRLGQEMIAQLTGEVSGYGR